MKGRPVTKQNARKQLLYLEAQTITDLEFLGKHWKGVRLSRSRVVDELVKEKMAEQNNRLSSVRSQPASPPGNLPAETDSNFDIHKPSASALLVHKAAKGPHK